MSDTQKYLTFCREEEWKQGKFWHTRCQGDTVVLEPGAFRGIFCLKRIDSTEGGFQWSRLIIRAQLPPDTDVRIYARTSDEGEWEDGDKFWENDGIQQLNLLFGAPVAAGKDAWLSLTGRYLWLALELITGGQAGPRVESLSLRMAGDHMVDYLPSIYQGQDFTYRYLSIFNSMFQDMERAIDELPRMLDVGSAGGEMLDYLAGWLCLRPGKEPVQLKTQLPDILENWEMMYTVEGIQHSARMLTGTEPYLIEHSVVDPNDPACKNPGLYRQLYGENPYRFFLLFPKQTFASQRDMEWFLERMQDRIPAGTELALVLLKPAVQLDVHTYLGINSRIQGYVPASITEKAALHYDMMIGGPDHER